MKCGCKEVLKSGFCREKDRPGYYLLPSRNDDLDTILLCLEPGAGGGGRTFCSALLSAAGVHPRPMQSVWHVA